MKWKVWAAAGLMAFSACAVAAPAGAVTTYGAKLSPEMMFVKHDKNWIAIGNSEDDSARRVNRPAVFSKHLLATTKDYKLYMDLPSAMEGEALQSAVEVEKWPAQTISFGVMDGDKQSAGVEITDQPYKVFHMEKELAEAQAKSATDKDAMFHLQNALLSKYLDKQIDKIGEHYIRVTAEAGLVDEEPFLLVYYQLNPYLMGTKYMGDIVELMRVKGDKLYTYVYNVSAPSLEQIQELKYKLINAHVEPAAK